MTTKLAKLRALLRKLFQLDQAELDFGIYRIMNQRRDEVERFLDNDLMPQVKEALEGHGASALEDEVFSDLFTFFRRYYHGGDFISSRRYKAGVYAIPYEGEEVKLHWANHDQYYIKSSEHLSNYAFKVGDQTIRFELVAANTERDNNKAKDGNERRFILTERDAVSANADTLVVRFEYRPDARRRTQANLDALAIPVILEGAPEAWQDVLRQRAPTKANPDRTLLGRHLHRYTARNTFDYFIHKDLEGFLRRELDFFIKNEILLLDDIDHLSDFAEVSEKLIKIKAMRAIAHKLIELLSQLEDFQKKLWLKKKFVVETHWRITLDRVPRALYPAIAANDQQREEWVRLFAIDRLQSYSEPLSVDFLEANLNLILDTRFFSKRLTESIIEHIDALDDAVDGLLVHGDNFQALRLLLPRYRGDVHVAYIDPPYNTGKDGFPYKDGYQSSSWLSAISDRAHIARSFLRDDGLFLASIADQEVDRLRLVLHDIFGRRNFLANLIWNNEGNIDNQSRVKINHEYVLAYCRDERSYPPAHVIAPDIEPDSKLYNDQIENSITKNGPANPPSVITLPAGFPATFASGTLDAQETRWPHLLDDVRVSEAALEAPARAYSGWSSRSLLDAFIKNDCQPIRDAKGLETWFQMTHTGAIYIYKKRAHQSHVLSIIRNVGTVKKTANMLRHMGFSFAYPKPVNLIEYFAKFSNEERALMLDFYAGSGTTAHAAISQTRAGNPRRYIAVESGAHFDDVIRPRLARITYAPEWSKGVPLSRRDGVSHICKCIRLESYEDALDNLELRELDGPQQHLLAANPRAREDYMLSYMLDVETRDSASLLDIKQFDDPFNYKIRVTRSNEARVQTVDLVETFNYLLGLRVERMHPRVHEQATFARDGHGRLHIQGDTTPCAQGEGWTFRAVRGRIGSDRVLVIWRTLTGDPEEDNLMLDAFYTKMKFGNQDPALDLIYVNGDSNLERLKHSQDTWRVRLIEEHFHRLMFDPTDT